MKMKKIALALLPICLLISCKGGETPSSSATSEDLTPSAELISKRLSKLDVNEITSFNFIDRSFDWRSYYNAKYIFTGDVQKAYVNYEAYHSFKVYEDIITDELDVDALVGVEDPVKKDGLSAKGQIFTDKNDYLYDYLVCEKDPRKSFVNCYEMDYFNNLSSYFNYLDIVVSAANAFLDPTNYFSQDDGYLEPIVEIQLEDGKEIYTLEAQYEGDQTYKPFILDFEVVFNPQTSSFEKIVYKERSLLNTLKGDFETETDALRVWTLYNIRFGEKEKFNGERYTFQDIPDKSAIHDAPIEPVDLSTISDGKLPDTTTLNIIRKINAYTRDIRQMNYSMLYHDAFDFATDSNSADFGDAIFSGKVISYSNNILDNVGTIQKVDANGLPKNEKPANFRIFTEVVDTKDAQGVLRIGQFDKYITSCLAFASKSEFQSTHSYLDANPLRWSEIADILSDFSTYDLGNNASSSKTIKITVSGEKKGTTLSLMGQIHSNSGLTEYIDRFTFEIENDALVYTKFETTGKNYTDTYEARFVHGPKSKFKGERISSEDGDFVQVTIDKFNII